MDEIARAWSGRKDSAPGLRGLRDGHAEAVGLAHVATVSFLASRAMPSAGFAVALAGGTAMARAGQRLGARRGYGASIAAMLESVAILGPARFGVPLTQAATAPMIGRLEARGVSPLLQGLACGGIRLLHNTLSTAFGIWVILGGLDAYAGSYDNLLGFLLPEGEAAALVLTAALLLGWAVFASAVQVTVYRRGLARWPDDQLPAGPPPERTVVQSGRAASLAAAAAVIAFAALIATTAWTLLVVVSGVLAVAWLGARHSDRNVVVTGVVLAAVLAAGALSATLIAGLGTDLALRRALRAALLVLVATWLRAAVGSEGLRDVFSRSLQRLRRLPAMSEAAAVLDGLGSDRRLLAAGRELLQALSAVPNRPLPLLDAVLAWVATQAREGSARPG